ncbi:MAG: hypothetical protein AAF657_28775, partial [Acidobacteriota bacterium]
EDRDGNAEMQRILQRSFTLSDEDVDLDEMLDRVDERMASGEDPFATLDRDREGEYLSVTGAIWKAFRGADKSEVVREAFEGLKEDPTFELTHEDSTFEDLDATIGPEIDYVVAGHTHLERRIPRRRGSGVYFNSGTWIRLMRLTEDLLAERNEFKRVFEVLSGSKMEDLDNFKYRIGEVEHPLVLLKPAVVSIRKVKGGVQAELSRVDLATGQPVPRPEGGS